MKVTIAIPNFNGEKLLEKNLPNILESGVDEVIVLDDGSGDKSLELLSKFTIDNGQLRIIKHGKNKGFIPSVNELVKNAAGELVVLLNNDVWVERDFLKPLTKHFEKKVFMNSNEVKSLEIYKKVPGLLEDRQYSEKVYGRNSEDLMRSILRV